MNETKHTTGPWMILFDDDEIEIVSNAGDRSVPVADIMLDAHTTFAPPMIEASANARLIAAAPDLLEALVALEHEYGPQTLRKAAAAIAKTRGQS